MISEIPQIYVALVIFVSCLWMFYIKEKENACKMFTETYLIQIKKTLPHLNINEHRSKKTTFYERLQFLFILNVYF